MQLYQQRVVNEKSELDDKLQRLNTFINSENFLTVDSEERLRLLRQSEIMTNYSELLQERITAFTNNAVLSTTI